MYDHAFLGWLNSRTRTKRLIALLVILAFLGLSATPTIAAVQQASERRAVQQSLEPSGWQAMEQTVTQLRRTLLELRGHWDERRDALDPQAVADLLDRVDRLHQRLERQQDKALAREQRLAERLARGNVPEHVRERHRQSMDGVGERLNAVLSALQGVTVEDPETLGPDAIDAALGALSPDEDVRPARAPEPLRLPSKAVEPEERREPRTTPDAFIKDELSSRALPELAAHGEFDLEGLPGASEPRWLESTAEVTLTEAIKDKAAELGHDPVRIHAWVRNNIAWLPTWGAAQTAEHTLSSRQGNAFDIASLQIALLRASDIPARYVHGTIEVEADAFRNWAGGFEDIGNATDFAASGGIPLTTLVQGGEVRQVRMEHIWVEAALDYFPSRGAVMESADAWVPLDSSFKQYEFFDGIDVAEVTGIDPEQVAEQFLGSGTLKEEAGYIQGFDAGILQATQNDAEGALEAHIASLPDDATVRDVLGGREIITRDFTMLPARLPNAITTVGARHDALPAALQHRITFGLGRDILGNLLNTVEFAWSEVNGERITLSFSPATADDEAALEALLPEGDIDDPADLPDTIPAGLVNLVPELRVAGEVVAKGERLAVGEEMDFAFRVNQRGIGVDTAGKDVVAGSYLHVTVAGGSVSPARLDRVRQRVEATTDALESENEQHLAGLTREELLGDLFHAGMLGYFAQLEAFSHQQAREVSAQVNLAPSAGTYGYTPNVSTLFGIPRAITPGGVTMDLDRIARTVSQPEDPDFDRATLNTQIGALTSALEHGIPEQQFSTEDERAEGISAAKALAIANAEGQRIYTIDQSNRDEALAALNLSSDTTSEIRQAVDAGRVVTTHTDPVAVPGWQGAGYVVLDPETGSGAWLIEGGLNGGFLDIVNNLFFNLSGAAVDILSFLGRTIQAIGDYATALQDVSRLLIGAAAVIKAAAIWTETESIQKTAMAVAINLMVSFVVVATVAFLATLTISFGVFVFAVIGIGVAAAFVEAALDRRFVIRLLYGGWAEDLDLSIDKVRA